MPRNHFGRKALLALALSAIVARGSFADDTPIGFSPGSGPVETKHEAHALSVPTPEAARTWLRSLTEEPHVAGTPADYRTAVEVRDKLRSWGWQADIAEFEVLLNYPRRNSVACEIVRPTPKTLKVTEDPVDADKDSASPDAFDAFHGYGVSGDVEAQVVYANFGRPEDFVALERMGIDVKDKVVLVRYGELFRGLKVRNAQKRGAKGVLIYSDPLDDGFARGDVFPQGPFRSPSAVQRGSVQFLSLGPGDPSTPAGPSIKGAKRIAIDPRNGFPTEPEAVKAWEKETGLVREDYYASIPSLPISYESARPILEAMGGPNVPAGWQGGLPIPYHVGPGPVEVHFKIEMDYQVRTIWNVIAQIKGQVEPDRWVMVGNHRDAWVYGAVDPGSGTASTLEMCRALGSAVNQGWKPRRTLVYASWDAEEYGLVGSTEWADQHADEIGQKALMLLNVDVAVSGPDLDVDGVPSLRELFLDAAGSVQDVRSGRSLKDLWTAKRRAAYANAPVSLADLSRATEKDQPGDAGGPTNRRFSPMLNPLGSGSDYTAFLDHLGVPSLDIGFSGRYGVYHSIYDDFFWMEKFGDPEFLTHATAAKLYTLIVMRAAAAEVAPLRFSPYADAMRDHLDDLRRMVAKKNRAVEGDAAKPASPFNAAIKLDAAIRSFESRAKELDASLDELARRPNVAQAQFTRVNDALAMVERQFLDPKGLPGRPWFKHVVYAPGLTTGYASWPLPGIRQGIVDGDDEMVGAQAQAFVDRVAAVEQSMKVALDLARREGPPLTDPTTGQPSGPNAGDSAN